MIYPPSVVQKCYSLRAMFGSSKKISHELATLRARPSKDWSYSQVQDLKIAKRNALEKIIAERPYGSTLDLSNVDLARVNMIGLDLRYIDFSGADLSHADMIGSDMRHTILTKTTLTSTDLGWVNLNGVNLTGTSIDTAIITGATFIGATIKGTTLPFKINLQGAKIEDQITLSSYGETSKIGSKLKIPSSWTPDSLDIYLNRTGSLLTTIDRIDCDITKIGLVSELIESLGDTDVLPVVLSLFSILGKAPYIADTKIAEWLDKLSLAYLKQYNKAVMPPLNEADLNFFEGMFSRQPELKFTANAAFIQFVAQAVTMGGNHKQNAIVLYGSYLKDERVKPYVNQEDFGDFNRKADWSTPHAMNFILLSAQENSERVMMFSQATLNGMLKPDINNPVWTQSFVYEKQENLCQFGYVLQELFKHDFPLFLLPYSSAENVSKFKQLLTILNLGKLRPVFEATIAHPKSDIKLVDQVSQQTLEKIFEHHLDYSASSAYPSLKGKHYEKLLEAYELSSAPPLEQAETLLSHAIIFTLLSSKIIFGTDGDSPKMLRDYACALMKKAHELDQSIFVSKSNGDQFKRWTTWLIGLWEKPQQTCSEMLSNEMIDHGKLHFRDTLMSILPPAWS